MPLEIFIKEHLTIIIAVAAVILFLVLIFVISRLVRPLPKKIASMIKHRKYMSMGQFFDSWHESKEDFPGCYVILIYDKKLILNPMNYDDIYVGQSVNVRRRIFSHLMGHGNGDVYFGRKSGCKVYLIITKCSRKKLNKAEKDLIAYFNATSSLNVTKGGSPKR